jgi:hypothetical protein
MSQFEHQGHESTGAPQSLPQDTVEIVDPNGNCLRFARSDFEELYTTSNDLQMRRHLRAGWLLVDERAADVTTYVLGLLKTGVSGTPVK